MQEAPDPPLRFRGGAAGALLPFLLFAAGASALGLTGAPDERGMWSVLLAALGAALLLCRDRQRCAEAMVEGMSRPLVLLMVMAWLLAGVFGAVLSASGLVEALAGAAAGAGVQGGAYTGVAFLVACLFSTATGTSLGTLILCFPLLYPPGAALGADPVWLAGALLGGATFGDNISPVSDTTIASAASQGAALGDVVRSRLRYALPAAAVALVAFVLLAGGAGDRAGEAAGAAELAATAPLSPLLMLAAPALVVGLLLRRSHLLVALSAGIGAALGLGLALGLIAPSQVVHLERASFGARGLLVSGLERGVGVSVFTLLLMALVAVTERAGLLAFVERVQAAGGVAAAERRIFVTVSGACLLTTHSAVAILTVGPLARRLGERLRIPATRRANLLDTTVCTYPFLLPWFIPTILAANLTAGHPGAPRLSALQVGAANLHSWLLLLVVLAAVFGGYGRGHASAAPPSS